MALTFRIQPDPLIECLLWERTESLPALMELLPATLQQQAFVLSASAPHRRHEQLGTLFALQQEWTLANQLQKKINGAPFLHTDPRHISISHCKKYLAIVLSENSPVGIDVEDTRRAIEPLAPRFLHPQELELFPGNTLKCVAWSMKEAVYKCLQLEGLDFREHIRIPKLCPTEGTAIATNLPQKTPAYTTKTNIRFKNKNYTVTLVCFLYDQHSYAIGWLAK